MTELTLNPGPGALPDKPLAVPRLPLAGTRRRNPRRLFSATRLAANDGGFRPFRIY